MEQNNKYTVQDLIQSAVEQKPVDFSQAFNGLALERLHNAVSARKLEIAQNMFGSNHADEQTTSEE